MKTIRAKATNAINNCRAPVIIEDWSKKLLMWQSIRFTSEFAKIMRTIVMGRRAVINIENAKAFAILSSREGYLLLAPRSARADIPFPVERY